MYGKLDVLYAGIVTENACAENKNRFLVFFDDGFAQYLPVKKLHHVYHTGRGQQSHIHYAIQGKAVLLKHPVVPGTKPLLLGD